MDQVGDRLPLVCPRRFGCCPDAARYSISADNVRTLRTFKGQTVNIAAFTAAKPGQTEITCRGVGPIKTPDAWIPSTSLGHRSYLEHRPAGHASNGPTVSVTEDRRYTSSHFGEPRRTFRRSGAEGVAAALQLR